MLVNEGGSVDNARRRRWGRWLCRESHIAAAAMFVAGLHASASMRHVVSERREEPCYGAVLLTGRALRQYALVTQARRQVAAW